MTHIKKALASLLLILAIVFNTAACDAISNIPFPDFNFGDSSDSDNSSAGGNQGVALPDDKPGGTEENAPDDKPENGEGDSEDDYVFGSEYETISVKTALEKAQDYTNSASYDVYYILVKIDEIESLKNGEMTVSDDTGSIYVYRAKDKDGNSLAESDLSVGDIAVISGTLRNYRGTLEIERGNVLAFYTPGEDIPTPPTDTDDTTPDTGGENTGSGTDNPSGDATGGTIIWPTPDDPITSDPYENVSIEAFYANYQPAVSYMDSYYRTLHDLMSGSIAKQDQAPTVSDYQPTKDGMLIKNTSFLYSDDGNTYFVVNAYGEVVNEIYRGGAYVTLEEVAAYVYAFGEPPANHSESKKTSPARSVWGIYLRVNHTKFSGSTSKYPYEPELPNISGCGGALTYWEMDVGTTGTDCDPSYPITDYNNGTSITRGAARIVYTKQDLDNDGVIEAGEVYLFYTYNHYNDFQEYLNYEGGWGEMFGNITGGGTLSSKYDYNPTPYPEVAYLPLVTAEETYIVSIVAILPQRQDI